MQMLRVLLAIIAACGCQGVVVAASKPETPSLSAKGLLYVGAWPNNVLFIDEINGEAG